MASEGSASRQHPILRAEVVGTDGTLHRALRVYCDVRQRSVELDVCRSCPSCVEIAGVDSSKGCVRCSPAPESISSVLPPSGAAVHRGVVAVDETVLVREIVALFVERGLRMIVVTGASGRAEGAVYESQLIREIQDQAHVHSGAIRLGWELTALESAAGIMFPVPTILETVSLREAVASMANLHQRQLLVVDEQGFPVGVLADVDALHALHLLARGRAHGGE